MKKSMNINRIALLPRAAAATHIAAVALRRLTRIPARASAHARASASTCALAAFRRLTRIPARARASASTCALAALRRLTRIPARASARASACALAALRRLTRIPASASASASTCALAALRRLTRIPARASAHASARASACAAIAALLLGLAPAASAQTNTQPTAVPAFQRTSDTQALSFEAADFGFRDADSGQTLSAVVIDTLPHPGHGTLTLLDDKGTTVTTDDTTTTITSTLIGATGYSILVANIDGLRYNPADRTARYTASFRYRVVDSSGASDDTQISAAATMSIAVSNGSLGLPTVSFTNKAGEGCPRISQSALPQHWREKHIHVCGGRYRWGKSPVLFQEPCCLRGGERHLAVVGGGKRQPSAARS